MLLCFVFLYKILKFILYLPHTSSQLPIMKKCGIAFLLFLLLKPAFAQLPVYQWAGAFLPHNQNNYSIYTNGRSVAVDQQGNVYSAGLFTYTTDFDPGPGVFALSAGGIGDRGIYISKLNASGNFIWAVQIPLIVEWGSIEIKVDHSGNVYLASNLQHAADMDPGPGVLMLTPIGAKDAFVVKLDGNGNLVWAKQFGGPGDTVPTATALDVDDNNNVIVCGGFNNTVDFDPGPGVFNLTSTAHIQSYVVKLNGNGDFIWAKQLGHSPVVYSGASVGDVECDQQGRIYIAGTFVGTCDFDPGAGVYTLQGHSIRDGFVSKLDQNGNFVWAKRFGNTTNESFHFAEARGLDIDANNNIYIAGDFFGTFDFDPGVNTHIITSSGFSDWYLLKLNDQGEFIWADVFGGTEHDVGADVAVDNSGDVYIIGTIGYTADMDPGPGIYTITPPNINGTSVLAKVDPAGGFKYALPFLGAPDGSCLTRRMVVDATKNIYITGYMYGTMDFDPGPAVQTLYAGNDEAPYVLKLARCMNITTATLNISTCNTYVLNNETFDSSGTYIRTIPNASGCDSIITLNLTINKKFTQQNIAICQGQSFFAGGAVQTTNGIYKDTLQTWLGCDSIVTTYLTVNPRPVPNLGPDRNLCSNTTLTVTPGSFVSYLWQDMSTQSSFNITRTGLFWVKVTNGIDCSATDTILINAIFPGPENFLKAVDTICAYGKLQLQPLRNFNQYLWSTGSTENKIIINTAGKYWLTVKDINDCAGTDTINIIRKECTQGVFMPSAFTPNGDGSNDFFNASVYGRVLSFRLQVFDRYGRIVFQTTDPDKKWDGALRGKPYSTTTFAWQCTYQLENRQPEYQKGTVVLIR